MSETQTTVEPIVENGYLVDPTTGEVLGLAEMPKPEFAVTDEESFNWVMKKILNAEADIQAVKTNSEVIAARAIVANADAIEKQARKKLEWLHTRFTAEIGEYAKQFVTDKCKTFKSVLGSVSFRKVPSKYVVINEENAIRLAEKMCPEAVKVKKSFLISQATPEFIEDCFRGAIETGELPAFDIVLESETVTIKTGVNL